MSNLYCCVFGYNLNVMKNHLVYNVRTCPRYLSVNTIRLINTYILLLLSRSYSVLNYLVKFVCSHMTCRVFLNGQTIIFFYHEMVYWSVYFVVKATLCAESERKCRKSLNNTTSNVTGEIGWLLA